MIIHGGSRMAASWVWLVGSGRTHGFTKKSQNCLKTVSENTKGENRSELLQIFGFPVMCVGTETLNNENLSFFMAILVSI